MKSEGAVIGKAVERSSGLGHELAREQAIGALIEEGAGFLTVPRGRQVQRLSFPHLDFPRHRSVHLERLRRQSFAPPRWSVVTEQNPFGLKQLDQGGHDRFPHGLQTCRQDLDHQPAIVAIHHERRDTVTLAVDEPVGGGVDSLPTGGAGGKMLGPPLPVDGPVGALQ